MEMGHFVGQSSQHSSWWTAFLGRQHLSYVDGPNFSDDRLWPPRIIPFSGAGTDRRSGNRDLGSTAAAMAGEEVGIKLVRLFSFIGAGGIFPQPHLLTKISFFFSDWMTVALIFSSPAICTLAINTYRDLERKKALDAARAVENVAHNDKWDNFASRVPLPPILGAGLFVFCFLKSTDHNVTANHFMIVLIVDYMLPCWSC